MTRWTSQIGAGLGILFLMLCGFSGVTAAAEALTPVTPREVQVGGELGRRIDVTVKNNLLKIDHDADFLKSFHEKNRAAFSYVGLGKEIDAAVRFAYFTQNPEAVALKKRLVEETIKSQLDDGYIGIFADVSRQEKPELGEGGRVQVWWDIHEMSYVIFGFVSDYRFFQNEDALAAARKAADYIIASRPATPIEVHVSTTGLELAFLALADATGEEKYREYVNMNDSLARWRGDVAGHAYNQLGVCLAQLELYRHREDPRLLEQSYRTLKFLTEEGGLLVSGTCSRDEGWHKTQEDTGKTGETCATAYFIRWLDRLTQIEAKPKYGDLMEQAIFNALFAAQSPDGRELRKYTPLTGAREFYEGEKSSDFKRDTYCCPNNYRRIIAELPGMIYYRSKEGIVVNLYTASRLETRVRETPVRIVQETEYPSRGQILLHVEPKAAVEFALKLRIPAWCEGATVRVNGKAAERSPEPGSFFTLNRTWQPGDKVELELPLQPRWHQGTGVHADEVALLYGPLLFCVNPTRQSETVQQRLATASKVEKGNAPHWPQSLMAESLEAPEQDAEIRPHGLAIRAKLASSEGEGAMLVFTEYTDPAGTWTYVRGPLLGRGSTQPK